MAKKRSKPNPRKGKTQTRYDWSAIRVAHEVGGKSFADLAKEFGAHHSTISAHAKKERWRDPAEVRAKASEKAADKKFAGLVSQEAEAVFKNRCEHAEISAEILKWVRDRIATITDPDAFTSPLEDIDLAVRRLSLILRTLGAVDTDIAGLAKAGDDFRSAQGRGGADSGAFVQQVQEALDRLDEGGR